MYKNYKKRTVEIDGMNIHETFKAVQYSDGEDLKMWLPKSQLIEWPEVGQTGTFEMTEWLAIEKELV